ncbi:MAG: hypothetical protein QOF76_4235 [Solirubrobacteraceae bacterium]|jgi:hypothetical protein|nr:hypothetical protein [Solirubrobacteraceae bacterium]
MTATQPRRLAVFGLMVLTVLGIAGNPVLALLLASRMTGTDAPVAGPYAVTAAIVLVGTVILVWVLGQLVNAYNRIVGYSGSARRSPNSWESLPAQDPGNLILGHVLLVAFAIAGAAGGVWFFFFAGSSI